MSDKKTKPVRYASKDFETIKGSLVEFTKTLMMPRLEH